MGMGNKPRYLPLNHAGTRSLKCCVINIEEKIIASSRYVMCSATSFQPVLFITGPRCLLCSTPPTLVVLCLA